MTRQMGNGRRTARAARLRYWSSVFPQQSLARYGSLMTSHVNCAVFSSASAAHAAEPALGPLPEWSLVDLYPGMDFAAAHQGSRPRGTRCQNLRGRLSRQTRRVGRARPRRSQIALSDRRCAPLRSLRRAHRQAEFLCESCLFRRYVRSGAGEILQRYARTAERRLDRIAVLSARAQSARRRCDRRIGGAPAARPLSPLA